MRIVDKAYTVYSFQELDSSIQEKLIIEYCDYDPDWYGHILEDEQDYHGFRAKIDGFDLDDSSLGVKELQTDSETLRDSYNKKYFSKGLTKKEYRQLSSELRLIPHLYIDAVRAYRSDSMLEIHDEFSCYYEDEDMNVDLERITTFLQDEYIDFKHKVIKDLQDAYDWTHSDERVIEDLAEKEYLEDGTVFYE
jgi:hypothetical protein